MPQPLSSLLKRNDRRSIGRANEVADLVLREPRRFRELMKCVWSDDAVLRMRAADAAEKVSAQKPRLLDPFKAELLGLLSEAEQKELRWHLALMIPRLKLTPAERLRACEQFQRYLGDSSSIVKTFAMQALVDLAQDEPSLHLQVRDLLEQAIRAGTPAMKARARKRVKRFKEAL
jgi:hypothetical protein